MAETDPATLIICDAGPLIHLDELGCLNLLRDFAKVQVPEAVWQEVQRHRPSALRRRTVKLSRVSSAPAATPELIDLTQAFLLDAGELEPLRLMQQNPGAILLTDDAAARLVAQRLDYEVHGTIGVVLRACAGGSEQKGKSSTCCAACHDDRHCSSSQVCWTR